MELLLKSLNNEVKSMYHDTVTLTSEYYSEVASVLIIILMAIGCSPPLYGIGRDMIKSCHKERQKERRIKQLVIRRLTSVDDNFLNDNILNDNSLNGCIICLDKYVKNDTLIELSCTHNFHEACILPWIKDNNTCPHCRRIII
jgi:hypothetical protein